MAWLTLQPKTVQAKWGAVMIDHEPEMASIFSKWVVNEEMVKAM